MEAQNRQFRTYSLGGIERLSLPQPLSLAVRKRLFALYQPQRLPAKLAWKFLTLLPGKPKIGKLYSVQQDLSEQVERFQWQRWLIEAEELLQVDSLIPVFYYPPNTSRRKFSIFLTDLSGHLRAYAKFAWIGSLQEQHLLTERKADKFLGALRPQRFDYPLLTHSGRFEETEYNLFQPLMVENSTTPNRWGQAHSAYWQEMKKATARQLEIQQLDWWAQIGKLHGDWLVMARWLADENKHVTCSAAHGDFVPWNLCTTTQKLTVFDWEYFEPYAPVLLDPVYFVLNIAIRYAAESSYEELLAMLCGILPEESRQSTWTTDLALALIYLRLQDTHKLIADILDRCAKGLAATLVN